MSHYINLSLLRGGMRPSYYSSSQYQKTYILRNHTLTTPAIYTRVASGGETVASLSYAYLYNNADYAITVNTATDYTERTPLYTSQPQNSTTFAATDTATANYLAIVYNDMTAKFAIPLASATSVTTGQYFFMYPSFTFNIHDATSI